MEDHGLGVDTADERVLERVAARFRERGIRLPRFATLAEPASIPAELRSALAGVDPDSADPLNLFRVHWFNSADRRGMAEVPGHLVLPRQLTGVEAPIVVLLGERFPMIAAHKVLAAYACLVPRLVTGRFDPERHRAVWPSTGNYCRGGVAISRILGCRGVAVLPEGMSAERFRWLERWVTRPEDIVRTPGTESNVKEIYDRCRELSRDASNVVLNQFAEFGNHLVHHLVTGRAFERVVEELRRRRPGLEPAAFVSASGSAGTLGAGDRLKETLGTLTVAVEAVECPTLLRNGFGAHNIQGIGDKHVPLIHDVMATDMVCGVSDRSTDGLLALFGSEAGLCYLSERRGVPDGVLRGLSSLGISGICNVLAAARVARYLGLGPDQPVLTVATDSAAMYASERRKVLERDFGGELDELGCAELFGEHVLGGGQGELLETTLVDRQRIFNLGYFTWVEQQGVSLELFEARRERSFWRGIRGRLAAWDQRIDALNARVGP